MKAVGQWLRARCVTCFLIILRNFLCNFMTPVVPFFLDFSLNFITTLEQAAQSTHAWIITSGCNMGAMKAVGEAVAEGQTYQWDRYGMTHTLRCIGVAPWGYVEKNACLVSRDSQVSHFCFGKTHT